jgi:hypothetical protein
MGGSWSSVFSTPTNVETKTILNTILKRLIQEVDMRDMYSLADPKVCREYIVVGTKALNKLFAKIRLDKGDDGTLYFQKIRGIQDKHPDPASQQRYCKELSFFFVRIFQIYAAISLSIMDSELPIADPIEVMRPAEMRKKGVAFINPQEGFKGFPQRTSWFSGLFGQQQGGRLTADADAGTEKGNFYLDPDRAGPYVILNRYLVAPANRGSRDALSFRIPSGSTVPMICEQESLYDFNESGQRTTKDFRTGTVFPKIKYNLSRRGASIIMSADLRIERMEEQMKVNLVNVSFKDKTGGQREGTFGIFGEDIKSSDGKEFLLGLADMFTKIANVLDPLDFSATEFLLNKGLIASREGKVSLIGTNIKFVNPGAQKGDTLAASYVSRYKMNDENTRETPIQINAELIIEEKQKTAIDQQTYIVKINTNNITTEPTELRGYLRIPQEEIRNERFRGRQSEFTDAQSPTNSKGETIPMFLEDAFKKMLSTKDEYEKRDGIDFTREGLPKPSESLDIPDSMRISGVWKALAKDPPVKAHCIARAVQLLNVAAIRGSETNEAFSSICRVKFPYAKDGSLPPAGQPITEEYGILALATLFVDKIQGGSPLITDGEKYKEFRKKFKFFFERLQQAQLEGLVSPDKLSDITEKLMPGICEGHTADKVKVQGSILYELRSKATQLINRQGQHVQASMAILFKLFDERAVRAGRFEISDYVQANGMQAVNQIAEEAREMLLNYYGDCELTYKEGLFALYNNYSANPDATKYTPVDASDKVATK